MMHDGANGEEDDGIFLNIDGSNDYESGGARAPRVHLTSSCGDSETQYDESQATSRNPP